MNDINVPFFDARRELATYRDELLQAASRVLGSGEFILGEEVRAFEESIAEYVGVRHAIGVASGTDALLLALKAVGITRGHAVVTTPFTFFATASAILNLGAIPVFVDIDPRTLTVSAEAIEAALTGRSVVHERLGIDPQDIRAILPVHIFGQPATMDRIRALGGRFGLPIVEDAAQALGAEFGRRRVGCLGEGAAFSFFPTKNLGGYGDGGLVTTNDDTLAADIRTTCAHGAVRKYVHHAVGINSRLDAMQAALLRVKLPHVPDAIRRRIEIARFYDEGLAGVKGVVLPSTGPNRIHTYHQYVVRIHHAHRDHVRERLKERGVSTAVHYPVPAHLQPAINHLGYVEGDLPDAERASREVLSLPIFPTLTTEEQARVVVALAESMRSLRSEGRALVR